MSTQDSVTPKIEIKEITDSSIHFYLYNCDVSMANALRRVMIGEVPTLAIDLVEIQENSSVLIDEMISHRLGLLPLRVETSDGSNGVDMFNYKRECTCEDSCPNCSAQFTLDAYNPGPETVKNIFTSDLTYINEGKKIFPASDDICIIKLGKGQRLKLSAIANKGISKIHAKWSPVSTAVFAYEADISLDETMWQEVTSAQKKEFVGICPAKVFGFDERQQKVVVERNQDCVFCDECVKLSDTWQVRKDSPPFVIVREVKNKYLFKVETTGSLKPVEIVMGAFKVLRTKLENLRERYERDREVEEEVKEAASSYKDTGGFL
eukprot:maker-scaffold_2-snap-gene-27.0-mRNA-1 protein AED:0.01 eAED:0.01 QI:54/1/1/1/1/1/3/207/320